VRDREPVVFNSAVTNAVKALVLSLVTLALAFEWVSWTDAQIAAVLGVITAASVVLSAVVSAFTRQKVSPVDQ
jgi:uncharacterized YccA/Bax inhibitor family protein